MKSYAFHDTVYEQLSGYTSNPTGNLLITGPAGCGLRTAVKFVLVHTYGKDSKPGDYLTASGHGIDDIRSLIGQLNIGRTNPRKPRYAIIYNAENLSLQAQNALLKVLEEPPKGTYFIMTSSRPDLILPTISSRLKHIKLRRPKKSELREVFAHLDQEDFDKYYAMSDGWPGLLHSAINQDSLFSTRINQARDFLGMTNQERFLYINSIADKTELNELIGGLIKLSQAAMRKTATDSQATASASWRQRLKSCIQAQKDLESNISPKLIGLRLIISL